MSRLSKNKTLPVALLPLTLLDRSFAIFGLLPRIVSLILYVFVWVFYVQEDLIIDVYILL